jgi:AraC-like DNA-binding protein/mannose-6-phosphate isomerase-like protein (cupin superfamily)
MEQKNIRIQKGRDWPPGQYSISINKIKNERWSFPLHVHKGYFEFTLITSGSITHYINEKKIIQKAGDLIVVREKDVHTLSGTDFTLVNIMYPVSRIQETTHFLGIEYMDTNIRNIPGVIMCTLEPEILTSFEGYFREMSLNSQYQRGRNASARFLIDLFVLLRWKLNLDKKPESENLPPTWLQGVLTWIERNSGNVSIHALIARANRTAEHVSRTFKKYTGLSPSLYCTKRKLEHAASLLMHSNFPLLEICMQTGFENPGYFHKLFKKYFTLTPGQYRKKYVNTHNITYGIPDVI